MTVFVACLINLDDMDVLGVYTSYELAASATSKKIEVLEEKNEDLGVYPHILEFNIDDVENDDYI